MKRAGLALLLVVSTGCIDLREEVRVHADGTAVYTVDMAMPEMFMGFAAAAGDSASSPGEALWGPVSGGSAADSTRTREFVEGDMHHFEMERDLRGLEQLAALAMADSAGEGMAGRIMPGFRVTRLDGNRVRLVRELSRDSTNQIGAGSELGEGLAGMATGVDPEAAARTMFAGRSYVLRLHAPRIESANGTHSADRTTVEWRAPMAALMSDSVATFEAVLVAPARK
jgi:hypothetical protein